MPWEPIWVLRHSLGLIWISWELLGILKVPPGTPREPQGFLRISGVFLIKLQPSRGQVALLSPLRNGCQVGLDAAKSCHGQFAVKSRSHHSQSHGQVTVKSRPDLGQAAAKSWSSCGQVTVKWRPSRSQVVAKVQPSRGEIMAKGMVQSRPKSWSSRGKQVVVNSWPSRSQVPVKTR